MISSRTQAFKKFGEKIGKPPIYIKKKWILLIFGRVQKSNVEL